MLISSSSSNLSLFLISPISSSISTSFLLNVSNTFAFSLLHPFGTLLLSKISTIPILYFTRWITEPCFANHLTRIFILRRDVLFHNYIILRSIYIRTPLKYVVFICCRIVHSHCFIITLYCFLRHSTFYSVKSFFC